MAKDKPVFVVAISGASGSIYGKVIAERLVEAGAEVHMAITEWGSKVLSDELSLDDSYFKRLGITLYDSRKFDVPLASGSFLTDGMIVAPCSMGCLGRIASGISSDLVTRAADVHLKEGRRLILVPRETPLSPIHLENMLKLSRSGATIVPAMPALTSLPKTVEDLATVLAGKVFDILGLPHDFVSRYEG